MILLRPLLNATRDEIMEFLAARKIAPRQDSSNADLRFTRNRIRQQVLPLLEQAINPQAARHLSALADQARRLYRRLQKQGRRLLQQALLPRVDNLIPLKRAPLAAAPSDVAQEALLQLWRREGWPRGRMTAQRWRDAIRVCRGERSEAHLPGKIFIRHALKVIQVGRSSPQAESP